MINVNVIKKWAALTVPSLITVVFFFVGIQFYGLLIGLACMFGGMLVSVLLGNLLLKNPFTAVLEGKGILAFDLSSTGVISPFIVQVRKNRIHFLDPKTKEPQVDIFDREAVHMMNVPIALKNSSVVIDKNNFYMRMTQDEFNNARFSLFQYPVLMYNSQLQTIVTKEMLSDNEKEAFAEHSILHLNHLVKDLNNNVRDFGRAVVESLKPKQSMFSSIWFWVIIGVMVIAGLLLFAPSIMNAIGGLGGNAAAQAIQTAGQATSGAVSPI